MASDGERERPVARVMVCRREGPGPMRVIGDDGQSHRIEVGAWASAVDSVRQLEGFGGPAELPEHATRKGKFRLCGADVEVWECGCTACMEEMPGNAVGTAANMDAWQAGKRCELDIGVKAKAGAQKDIVDRTPVCLAVSIGGTEEDRLALEDAVPSCKAVTLRVRGRDEFDASGASRDVCWCCDERDSWLRDLADMARSEERWLLLMRAGCVPAPGSVLRAADAMDCKDEPCARIGSGLLTTVAMARRCGDVDMDLDQAASRLAELKPPYDERPQQKVAVVVTVHNALASTVKCLHSVDLAHPGNVDREVVVVDDGSDDHVAAVLAQMCEERVWRFVRHDKAQGYTASVNEGVAVAIDDGADWVCILNSDTVATDGWLWRMVRRGLEDPTVMLVGPVSNNAVHATVMPRPGHTAASWSQEMAWVSRSRAVDVPTPTGFCLCIRAEAWRKHGPFDRDYYGDAYGEECGLWAQVVEAGWRAVVADDAFVWHEGHASYGKAEAKVMERRAVDRFLARHGDVFWARAADWQARQATDLGYLRARASDRPRGHRPRVTWLLNDYGLYGGVLAIAQVADRLCARGWDAIMCCSLGVQSEALMALPVAQLPKSFGSYDASMRDLADWAGRGVLSATVWNTAEIVALACERNRDLVPCYFVQDDEARFVDRDGRPYTAPENVRASYGLIPTIVANSPWVARVVEQHGGRDVRLIHVGVCTRTFRPRARASSRPMVLLFHRPETPRRGSPGDVAAEIHRRDPGVRVAAYGSRDGRLPSCVERLGKMSQREVARWYAASDVFVECSEVQGFGLQGLEAMASGCGLVSTPCLGINAYGEHERNCLIAEPGDLADAVLRLLGDRDLRGRLREAGLQTATEHDWERVTDRHERLYRELLGMDDG